MQPIKKKILTCNVLYLLYILSYVDYVVKVMFLLMVRYLITSKINWFYNFGMC